MHDHRYAQSIRIDGRLRKNSAQAPIYSDILCVSMVGRALKYPKSTIGSNKSSHQSSVVARRLGRGAQHRASARECTLQTRTPLHTSPHPYQARPTTADGRGGPTSRSRRAALVRARLGRARRARRLRRRGRADGARRGGGPRELRTARCVTPGRARNRTASCAPRCEPNLCLCVIKTSVRNGGQSCEEKWCVRIRRLNHSSGTVIFSPLLRRSRRRSTSRRASRR